MATVLETNSASVQEEGLDLIRVNQYMLKGKLGEGAYGVVLECEDDKHDHFALKCVSKSLLKRQKEYTKVGRKMTVTTAFDDVKREIALMKKLNHPRIVSLYEVVDDPDNDKLFMIMELVNGGQVMDWDKERKGFVANPRLLKPDGGGVEMSEAHACLVLRDVIEGLDYLHRSRIVHRDLKPQNLLLTNDKIKISVKIADFGVSHMFEGLELSDENGEKERLTKVKGTYFFYAPESLEASSFDGYKADVWALGINLYCFLTGKLPFYDESPLTLFELIQENAIDYDVIRGKGCSESCVTFLQKLLEKNPDVRFANARAVMDAHEPWLGDFEQDPKLPERVISITEADISNAVTTATLSFATVATLKVFVQKWRKRASLNASRRRDDETLSSIASEPSRSPALSDAGVKKIPSAVSLSAGFDSPLPSPAKRFASTRDALADGELGRSGSASPKSAMMKSVPSLSEVVANLNAESTVSPRNSNRKVNFSDVSPAAAPTVVERAPRAPSASQVQTSVAASTQPQAVLAVASGFGHGVATPSSSATRKRSRACIIS